MGRIPRLALIGTKLFREAIHAILRKNREELNINISHVTSIKQLFLTFWRYDIIHVIFSATITYWGLIVPLIKFLSRGKKIIIMHWIGSDVLILRKSRIRRFLNRIIQPFVDYNLTVSEPLQEALKQNGVKALKIGIFLPRTIPENISSLPSRLSILFYLPRHRYAFYGGEIMERVARDFPEAIIYVVRNDGEGMPKFPNVKYLGFIKPEKMSEIYKKIKVCIRFTKHDGLPLTVLESLVHGRYAIFNHAGVFPENIILLARNYEDVRKYLMQLRNISKINYIGRQWALNFIKKTEKKMDLFL
ncbi:MAG: hypothetical protein ACTSX9_06970 [Candidatus Njordarchaeales archaeon]